MGIYQQAWRMALKTGADMKYCACREIGALVKTLVRKGWTFRRGGKHGKLRGPSGTLTLTVPRSPSDHRAFLNFNHDVRHVLSSI